MQLLSKVLRWSFALVIAGCVSSAPINNSGFWEADTLNEFSGTYINAAESGNGASVSYLSSIFWPSSGLNHAEIDDVVVEVKNGSEVLVSGRRDGELLVSSLFIEGEHFNFSGGRIQLRREIIASAAYPSGNPFIGLGYTDIDLGIDKSGHGKLREKVAFAGTAFIFIPLVGAGSDDFRFVRKDD